MKTTLQRLRKLVTEAMKGRIKVHPDSLVSVRNTVLNEVDQYVKQFNAARRDDLVTMQRMTSWFDSGKGVIVLVINDHTNPYAEKQMFSVHIDTISPTHPKTHVYLHADFQPRGDREVIAKETEEGIEAAIELHVDPRGLWWADENLYAQRPIYRGEWTNKPPVKGWCAIDPLTGEEHKPNA